MFVLREPPCFTMGRLLRSTASIQLRNIITMGIGLHWISSFMEANLFIMSLMVTLFWPILNPRLEECYFLKITRYLPEHFWKMAILRFRLKVLQLISEKSSQKF